METPEQFDRVESAANVFVRLSLPDNSTIEIPISELDRTKEVDVERVREMGLYPDGYSINAIDVDGSLTFSGSVVRLPGGGTAGIENLLFNEEGAPEVFDITIVHEDPEEPGSTSFTETIENCIVTSDQYSASSGETTESSYEFMGQRIN